MTRTTRLLSAQDVRHCVTMKDALETTEASLRDHGNGRIVLPCKITLDMSALGVPNWINAMPAYVEASGMAGVKWIGGFINNPKAYGLPFIIGLVILSDPWTGLPVAIMDGAEITTLRTGAAAAIAAKYLARTDSSVVALIGAGTQGRSSLLALSQLFSITQIRIADIVEENAIRLSQEIKAKLGIDAFPTNDFRAAVSGADVIITATPANEPLVVNEWVQPGAFMASLGSFQELDTELVLRVDKLVVDHREQSKHRGQLVKMFEAGMIDDHTVFAELGEIVAGHKAGREFPSDRILACLTGTAFEDIALAARVYERAKQLNLGAEFDFLA